MSKPPLVPTVLTMLGGLFAGVVLVDKLGSYRWFSPYDQDLYAAALFIAVLESAFVVPRLAPWFERHQAKLDREDGEIR